MDDSVVTCDEIVESYDNETNVNPLELTFDEVKNVLNVSSY